MRHRYNSPKFNANYIKMTFFYDKDKNINSNKNTFDTIVLAIKEQKKRKKK